ncbi:MAG: conserved exported protein of unknown function [Nitrospira sp.]|nr:MAG: conserved exported protein of unknown function [Nitrospira sp.]
MSLLCRDQFLRMGKFALMSSALVFVSCWCVSQSSAQQIRVVPSISVLEQYDSNVFFTPKSQLAAGTKADDLITTFTPQLNFMQNTNLLKTNLSLGAVVQKFAHNSDLDNVGFNASGGVDLSQAVNRVLPRTKMFRIFGTYRYSPSTPAFGAGGLGGGFGGGGGFGVGGVGISGPVDSGLLTQRIRTSMYSAGLADSYSLSPTTDFQTTYTYSQLSFGGSYTPTSATSGQASQTVFDTTTHSITAGPSSRITAIDTLTVKYMFTQTSQAQFGDYTMHGGTVGWGRAWTKELSSSLNGGLTLIEPIPDSSVVGGQRRVPATMFPTAGVSLTYASGSSFLRKLGSDIQEITGTGGASSLGGNFLPLVSGMNMPGGIAAPGSYRITLLYNLGVFPSFVQSAGPIYTHTVSLVSAAGITDKLTAQGLFNVARSSFTSDAIGTTFTTYGTTVSLNYLITPTFTARLSHQWLMFDNQTSGLSAGDLGFSKHVILLGFTYAYAPRGDFFRSGAFWEGASGASSSVDAGAGKSGSGGVDTKK